jgi:hypothetical protein
MVEKEEKIASFSLIILSCASALSAFSNSAVSKEMRAHISLVSGREYGSSLNFIYKISLEKFLLVLL